MSIFEETTEVVTDQLAVAVIQWLSEFLDSPLKADASPSTLTNPIVLFKLFKILLNKDDFKLEAFDTAIFANAYDVVNSETSTTVPLPMWLQIDVLNQLLVTHLKKHANSIHQLSKVDFYKLIILRDKKQIKALCQTLIVLGTFSSKMASRGQAFIEFLLEDDRMLLKRFDILQRDVDHKTQRQQFDSLTPTSINQGQIPLDTSADPDSNEACYVITEEELKAIEWECQVFNQVINKICCEKEQLHSST